MIEVVHVAGARPNFPKLAPVVAALDERQVKQYIVHTGQHYDDALSESFFRDLRLPRPDVNLGVGSGNHATQTAALLASLGPCFEDLDPELVLVYGDVNSTMAAALVASKMGISVGHVEAGLRSFDWTMPEEINRTVTDVLSDLLFVTSAEAVAHLARSGVPTERIHFVGNTMIDSMLAARSRFDDSLAASLLKSHGRYAVVTLHRPGNVDSDGALRQVVQSLMELSELVHLVFPVHPRGRAGLERAGAGRIDNVTLIAPQPYLRFMGLVSAAALVLTDSGGLQEETTILNVPCLTLRPNTERPVTVTHGTNRLVGNRDLLTSARAALDGEWGSPAARPPLWDGLAGSRIADVVASFLALNGGVES